MKLAAYFISFSILVAIGYNIIFYYVYPLVAVDASLVSLFILLGAVTCLLISGVYKCFSKTFESKRCRLKHSTIFRFTNLIGERPDPIPTSHLSINALGSPLCRPANLFFSYSHKDEPLKNELETHLKLLERQALISGWHDRKILPGSKWDQEIDHNLETAQIVLLLISADFIASEYCWGREVRMALERHESGEAIVVPIILRPCDWQSAPFAMLQGLPREMKPITSWTDRDAAWTDVSLGIRAIAEKIRNDR